MTRRLIHLAIAVVVLLGATTFAPNAYAGPYWRFITYYDGCGANMQVTGTASRDCSGNWTYNGQQSGHWMDVDDVSCSGPPIENEYIYEYCNGVWVQVDIADFGNCSC